MRGLMILAAVTICGTVPAFSQTKPAAPAAAGTCAVLMKTYTDASKSLASNFASSVGDNSAPRATLREMEDANTISLAKIALDLMRDYRCALPKVPPSAGPYLSQALACETAKLKAPSREAPDACKRENWIAEPGS